MWGGTWHRTKFSLTYSLEKSQFKRTLLVKRVLVFIRDRLLSHALVMSAKQSMREFSLVQEGALQVTVHLEFNETEGRELK